VHGMQGKRDSVVADWRMIMSNPRLTAAGPMLSGSGTELVGFDVQSIRVTQSWGVQPGDSRARIT